MAEDFIFLPIHEIEQRERVILQCMQILNSEWPRSETIRRRALESSSPHLPMCLALCQKFQEKLDVIGHAKISKVPSDEESVFVESVIVHPGLRGKGLGKYLMLKTEQYCWNLGIRKVYLTTTDKQIFYSCCGYKFSEPVCAFGGSMKLNVNLQKFAPNKPRTEVCANKISNKKSTSQNGDNSISSTNGSASASSRAPSNGCTAAPTPPPPPSNGSPAPPPPPSIFNGCPAPPPHPPPSNGSPAPPPPPPANGCPAPPPPPPPKGCPAPPPPPPPSNGCPAPPPPPKVGPAILSESCQPSHEEEAELVKKCNKVFSLPKLPKCPPLLSEPPKGLDKQKVPQTSKGDMARLSGQQHKMFMMKELKETFYN